MRYRDFLALDYPRKVVTIEPIMDFDLNVFRDWIVSIDPEHVWLGFNSKSRSKVLKEKGFAMCEPPEDKVQQLIYALEDAKPKVKVYKHGERAQKFKGGIEVRGKTLRGVKTRSMGRKGKARRKG